MPPRWPTAGTADAPERERWQSTSARNAAVLAEEVGTLRQVASELEAYAYELELQVSAVRLPSECHPSANRVASGCH